jgi:hypothetical protein
MFENRSASREQRFGCCADPSRLAVRCRASFVPPDSSIAGKAFSKGLNGDKPAHEVPVSTGSNGGGCHGTRRAAVAAGRWPPAATGTGAMMSPAHAAVSWHTANLTW